MEHAEFGGGFVCFRVRRHHTTKLFECFVYIFYAHTEYQTFLPWKWQEKRIQYVIYVLGMSNYNVEITKYEENAISRWPNIKVNMVKIKFCWFDTSYACFSGFYTVWF